MKSRPVKNTAAVLFLLFTATTAFLYQPAKLDARSVPESFSAGDFTRIINIALNYYIDPKSIDIDRGYVGAAKATLQSLPYPLHLMPVSFYKNRAKYAEPGMVTPGKLVYSAGDRFVIFQPDYAKFRQMKDAYEKRERARLKKLTPAQRAEEVKKNREEQTERQNAEQAAWVEAGFGRSDLEFIVDWIQNNHVNYSKMPAGYEGANRYKDNPFGMHHVYFAATQGFLNSFDPHSNVMAPETWDKIRKESEDATFEGIGALLRGGDLREVIVETPMPGSPAVSSGLRAGDIIRKVDGKSIENLSLSEVVKQIRGPKDTIVTLTVDRPSELATLDIKIKRGVIERKAVTGEYLKSHNVGVIKINSFLYDKKPTSEAVKETYSDIVNQADGALTGLILDLRNNPGGELDEAIRVSGLFLGEGVVVTTVKNQRRQQERVSPVEAIVPEDLPIIVMVNSGSASASEILASALQDHNRALIVGDRTFGKATVQQIIPIDEVLLKLTIARYYAPDGYTIQVYGVQPDIKISEEPDQSFPPRYREEDMWKHMPELTQKKQDDARAQWIELIGKKIGENKAAEKYLKTHEKDAIKPDYMQIRALSYFEALRQYPVSTVEALENTAATQP